MELICTTGELSALIVGLGANAHVAFLFYIYILEGGHGCISHDGGIVHVYRSILCNLADYFAILLCKPSGIKAADRLEHWQCTIGIERILFF